MRPYSPNPPASEHELSEIRADLESRTGMWFDLSGPFGERVREHMRAKRVANPAELLRAVKASNADYESLLDRLLARDGAFFRYPGMFGALEMLVLPEIHMRKFWDSPRSLRMWSAGCGAGYEAYSLAMTVADVLQLSESWVVEILATDASRNAVQHAQRGVFSPAELESLPEGMREANFARIGGQYLVKPRIRNLVTFLTGGLVQTAYMGRFDCIFCTDVLTLIQDDKRGALAERLFEMLEPGGYMFLLQSAVTMAAQPLSAGEVAIYHKPNTSLKIRSEYATEV
jgi:chemotaxis methyl-accepting protein methylase